MPVSMVSSITIYLLLQITKWTTNRENNYFLNPFHENLIFISLDLHYSRKEENTIKGIDFMPNPIL